MICRHCGAEIPEVVNFCICCGQKLVDEVVDVRLREQEVVEEIKETTEEIKGEIAEEVNVIEEDFIEAEVEELVLEDVALEEIADEDEVVTGNLEIIEEVEIDEVTAGEDNEEAKEEIIDKIEEVEEVAEVEAIEEVSESSELEIEEESILDEVEAMLKGDDVANVVTEIPEITVDVVAPKTEAHRETIDAKDYLNFDEFEEEILNIVVESLKPNKYETWAERLNVSDSTYPVLFTEDKSYRKLFRNRYTDDNNILNIFSVATANINQVYEEVIAGASEEFLPEYIAALVKFDVTLYDNYLLSEIEELPFVLERMIDMAGSIKNVRDRVGEEFLITSFANNESLLDKFLKVSAYLGIALQRLCGYDEDFNKVRKGYLD